MKWNSIRTKVFALVVVCLCFGLGGTVALMHYGFERNSQVLAKESVTSAQTLFAILEAREISKMAAVSEAVIVNPQIRDALAAKDRTRLLALTAELYPKLKSENITNWMFHTSEPDRTVLLRLHNPTKFGDQLNRFMDKEVVRTHSMVVGAELAKAGFAVRILRPVFNAQGGVAGYLEFGEELGKFIHAMKDQTGSDYGLLLNKKYVDRQFWADSSATLKRRDNWNDNSNFVIADKTSDSDSIMQFGGDLATVPVEGKVLERYKKGNSVFVRGVFPIQDAAGNNVGAMFVVKDISSFYLTAQRTQYLLVIVTVVVIIGATFAFLELLNLLIFRRLVRIITVATRLVGGDYASEIKVNSTDEIGQFELLFEQFRLVFIDVLSHIPELQDK